MSAPLEAARAAAIALYDRYTHEGMDRRAFMAQLTRIAGSTAAASVLLAGISADPAAASVIPAEDARIRGRRMRWPVGGGRFLKGYQAEPRAASTPLGSILVIHEYRGLNAHVEDVTRRLAVAGYRAVAPDFLTPAGGTPTDLDAARAAIGRLDISQAAADASATLGILKSLPGSNGRAGAIGFCWGGGMVNRLAVAAGPALHAGVAYYGPAPDRSLAARVEAAMLLHYADNDARVNATGLPWAEALKAAGKRAQSSIYPGMEHAFHNDTAAERYNGIAAELSWRRTLQFLAGTVGQASIG